MTTALNSKILQIIHLLLFVVLFCPFASGRVIYVDDNANGANDGTSWVDAYTYLKDALTFANSDNKPIEIRVAGGVYRPVDDTINPNGTNNRLDTFQLINGVSLKGGFAGSRQPDPNIRDFRLYETILSGDLAGDDISWDELMEIWALHNPWIFEPNREDNTCNIITGSGTDETAVLDGFTVSSGCAAFFEGKGGGIYINAGSPTIINCMFKRNWAYNHGGGICCENGSNPVLANCIISRNWALYSGGMYNYKSNPSLRNCLFSENFAYVHSGIIVEFGYRSYGGMFNINSDPTLINCNFIKNLDVGMYNSESNPTLINCIFRGNIGSRGGGIANTDSSPSLINCILSGNGTNYGYGGGIYGGSPILINCTIIGNQAYEGGGIYYSNPKMVNCIVWGNSSPQIMGSALISFSNIQGGWIGEGNIDSDPLFVDADGDDDVFGNEDDDFRLLADSPCIDAGDNSSLPQSLVKDVENNPRIVNGIVDMGAYESPLSELMLSTKTLVISEGDTATFTLALANSPSEIIEVAVTHFSGDEDITIESGGLLTFDDSNYSIPQVITLSAAEDSDNLNGIARIGISTHNLCVDVKVIEMDNEPDVGILFVDDDAVGNNNGANWIDACNNLQDALSSVAKNVGVEEIRVAQGTYQPDQGGDNIPGDRTATFQLINGIVIKGGYAGNREIDPNIRDFGTYVTILSGDLNGDDIELSDPCDLPDEPTKSDNSQHVVTGSNTDGTAVLDGFTITHGNAVSQGSGMYNKFGSPTLANCTFIENSTESEGAGMYNYSCSPILTNCSFIRNSANISYYAMGGGICNIDSNPTLTKCRFQANSAYYGGGIYNFSSNPTFTDCQLIGNTANYGGGMHNHMSSPIINNSIFIENSVVHGGGIHNSSHSQPILTNCTFVGNLSQNGNALGCDSYNQSYPSIVKLVNCIVWDGGSEIYNNDLSTIIIICSDIHDGWEGEENIDLDPLFADAVNGDYHLKSQAGRWDPVSENWVFDDVTSPCIDAGYPFMPVGDEPMPNGGRINMGAYGGTSEASKSIRP